MKKKMIMNKKKIRRNENIPRNSYNDPKGFSLANCHKRVLNSQ